jgi:glycerol-3-phosphate O-acyltransferase
LGFIDRDPEEAWITCSPGAATLLTWYRNNVLHLFALPALIALLISRSTRGLAERALIEQVALIYPYVAQELTTDPEPNISAALDALEAQGLIRRNGQILLPPNKPSEAYEQLAQLASSILEMLQRMYVVVCIATQRPLTADELKSHSLATAKKLARLLGVTGAEFSEDRLFDAFLDRLLAAHHMTRNERGHLVASPLMHQVAERAAEQIIEPSVHLALQRVIQSSLGDITQPQDTHQNEHSSP